MREKRGYEEGFLIILLLLAIVGLIWLFQPFLEALFFAMILATASYPYYQKVLARFNGAQTSAAGVMSSLVFVGVIAPVSYLLVEASLQLGHFYSQANALEQLKANSEKILSLIQQTTLLLLQGVLGTTSSFFTFLGLAVFALFFFYRDGHAIAKHIQLLSPLENRYDQMIMNRFASLSNILTLSVLGIAVMQGLSFAILAWFLGLPGVFIGMAVAVTSFIPIVGAALVWVPMVIYLMVQGDTISAVVVIIWGVVVAGFVIDNIARPVLIARLSKMMGSAGDGLAVGNHGLMTVLSTFAGLIHFGVIGLFFGPVLAAMAITIFDVYEEMHRDKLDRT